MQFFKENKFQDTFLYKKLLTMILEYEFDGNAIKEGLLREEAFSNDYLQFISKLKKITKNFLRENLDMAYRAKLVLRQSYVTIDCEYSMHTDWLRSRKNASIKEKLDAKYHATQIDSIIQLQNGDVAVSGGPKDYEVLVYKNKISEQIEPTTQYEVVDSISTKGH